MEGFNQYQLIALDDALKRVGNRKPLLIKLLNAFINNPRYNEILLAYEERNLEAVAIALHTLKGVASNLSLERLYKCVESLEIIFKDAVNQGDVSVFDRTNGIDIAQIAKDTVNEVSKVIETLV